MDNKMIQRTLMTSPAMKTLTWPLSITWLFLLLIGCQGVPISYYDSTTYEQLTALKAETMTLVESFDLKPVSDNEHEIKRVTLNLRKALEYELGKGKPNSDTAKQFKLISNLLTEDVNDYRQYGPASKDLGKKYFSEASVAIGQAFDIAISTENMKNKDKR